MIKRQENIIVSEDLVLFSIKLLMIFMQIVKREKQLKNSDGKHSS